MAEKAELKPVPVRKRTAARLGAIQVNYEMAMSDKSLPDLMAQFLAHYAPSVASEMQVKKIDEAHFNELITLIADKQDEVDSLIAQRLGEGWSLDRLARHELCAIRAKAVISEYAGLTDAYQGDVKFVNAVMDRLARELREMEMAK